MKLIRLNDGRYYRYCLGGTPVFKPEVKHAARLDPSTVEMVMKHLKMLAPYEADAMQIVNASDWENETDSDEVMKMKMKRLKQHEYL